MSGEPKTHTLEEALQLLGPDEALLVTYCGWEGMQYSVVEESSVKFLTHSYSKWEDALSDRLDRKVVARDDAAELSVYVLKWRAAVEAERDAFHNAEQDDGPSAAWMHHGAAQRELNRAERNLLNLAAALAATEGSES